MKKILKTLIILLLISFLSSCGEYQKTLEKHLQFTEIGEAFEVSGFNEGLPTNVVLPEVFNDKPVIKIGQDAFRASNIKSITIPESYQIIADEAFLSSLKLEKVIFTGESSLVEIGNNAFWGNHSLRSITIPKSVKIIGEQAFSNASSLKEVNFAPNSQLEEVGSLAFSGENLLKTITLPKSVKKIGNSVFSRNYQLESINVESGNLFYSSIDGVLYNKDQTILISYPTGKKDEKFILNDNVREINKNAFYHSKYLKRIILNNNLTKIADYAFTSTKELVTIVIPKSVVEIGAHAFKDSSKLSIFTYYNEIPNSWNSNWNSSNLEVYLNNSWDYDLNNNPQPK